MATMGTWNILEIEICLTLIIGKVKVIIAPHDAHALRATNNLPCDVYCELLEGHFLDFYSIHESTFLVRSS